MMKIFYRLLIAVLLCSINHSYAMAAPELQIDAKVLERAESALYFAGRENWAEAAYHARAANDPAVLVLVDWMQYRSKASGASFEEITRFIAKYPDWPDMPLLRQRAEEAITTETSDAAVLKWFKTAPPVTGDGLKSQARAEQRQGKSSQEAINNLLRQAWVKGNFGIKEETEFLAAYGNILRLKDYNNRIDELLWQGKIEQVMRILNRVDQPHRQLFQARMALMKGTRNAIDMARAVPKELRSDAGLLYERVMWHNKRDESDKVLELLQLVPASVPYPHKWWDVKTTQIRLLLKARKYQQAYQLASKHSTEKGEDFAEGEWLSGWIALRFLKNPSVAYKHFYMLHEGVEYPVSLARGAYWAGRASEQSGNKELAIKWYKEAADYSESFYGQLAMLKISKQAVLDLPEPPVVTEQDLKDYKRNLLVRAAFVAGSKGRYDIVKKLLKAAVSAAKSEGEVRLITEFGIQLRQGHIAVETAKHAARKGVLVAPMCYPVFDALPSLPLEQPLALAIIRQESSFDRNAESPAGALGLMQLMPTTAAGVARELSMQYAAGMLKSDHIYNIRLGSYYLAKLVRGFEGSYVLAIAAYNGGQGNVRKWLRDYGDPRQAKSIEEVIDWIELIPFSETRNYVARVLEGVQVYRQLLSKPPSKVRLGLAEDLLRPYEGGK